MYKVTNKFREQVYSGEALYRANLTINGIEIPNEQIAKITIKDPIIDTSVENFYLGSFIAKTIKIKFKNLDNINIESGSNVYLEIGQLIDEEYEYVPIGYFLIDELDENYYTTCEIICYDYSLLFKPSIDYSPVFKDGKATIEEILKYICNYFNVELGDYPDINNDVEIGVYDSTISGKQWISYIAEIKGCNAKIDRNGVLQLIPFNDVPDVTINALESAEFEIGEKYKISKVIYFDALRNYTFGDDTGNILYIRQDNPFIVDNNVVQNVYNNLLAITKTDKGEEIVINNNNEVENVSIQLFGDTYQERVEYNLVYEDNPTFYEDNKLIYRITPTKDNPSNIETVSGVITIINRSEITDPEDENYHYDEYEINLGNVELLKYGKIQDKIYLSDNIWYYTNYFTKIDNYNGEEIDSDIIYSTTGCLDRGATIYYYNKNNTAMEIPTEELVQQLNAINNMRLYDGINIIETQIESGIKPILYSKYIIPIDFTLYSIKNKNYGDISLDAYDVIDYTLGEDEQGNLRHYLTYNDNVTTYEMNIMTEISTQIPTKQKEVTTNVVGGDTPTRIKMLKTKLDYVNNQIEMMVKEQEDITSVLNQVLIDVNLTKDTFQITGGNNLIKNSQFLYDDPETTDEQGNKSRLYWEFENNGSMPFNNLGNGYDSSLIGQTVATAKIQLRDEIASTTSRNIINLKTNQVYTLTYMYKQDDLTTTRIQLIENVSGKSIYDKTYSGNQNEFKSEKFQFIAKDTAYVFKITTTTTSGENDKGYFYLYDLMLNSGDEKAWELAIGEIYSTVIQLSQLGLQIFTNEKEIATLLTSEGFEVVKYQNNKIGDIVTQFTIKGLKTNIAETNQVHTGNYVMRELTINNREHHVEYFKD